MISDVRFMCFTASDLAALPGGGLSSEGSEGQGDMERRRVVIERMKCGLKGDRFSRGGARLLSVSAEAPGENFSVASEP